MNDKTTEAEKVHWLEVKLGIATGAAIACSLAAYILGYYVGAGRAM